MNRNSSIGVADKSYVSILSVEPRAKLETLISLWNAGRLITNGQTQRNYFRDVLTKTLKFTSEEASGLLSEYGLGG
jgi:hypothetical protein